MKNITFSFLFFALATGASAQVVTHTTSETFENAFPGTLVLENFEGAPEQPSICGAVVSSMVNDCFDAEELISGFEIRSTNNGPVVLLPAGFLPSDNQSPRLGANAGAETTTITFTGNDAVYAVGHALHVDNNGNFNYKVINVSDQVIFDEVMTYSPFFGITSSEAIKRVEIKSVANNGELIGDLQLGRQSTMGIGSPTVIKSVVYPNPTTGIIKLEGDNKISTLAIYNMLGQQVVKNEVNSNRAVVDITALNAGNYILTASYEDGATSNIKVVKK